VNRKGSGDCSASRRSSYYCFVPRRGLLATPRNGTHNTLRLLTIVISDGTKKCTRVGDVGWIYR
jgi:hypothetical protein